MKTLLACVVTGLLVSGALGATTIKMVDHATGLSVLDPTAPGMAGSTRTIDIVITTDEPQGLISWGINGLQPPTPGHKQVAQITTANYVVGDQFNWDSTGSLTTSKQTGEKAWPALPGLSIGTICYIDTSVEPAEVYPATSGHAMSFKMTLPQEAPIGAWTAQSVYAGRYPSGNSDVTFFPLVIPEPATLLLLAAGGLAAARRRR